MMQNNRNKEQLFVWITMVHFMMVDLMEYLDTHPDDTEALKSFEKHRLMREQTAKTYTERFGPIVPTDSTSTTRWSWIDDAWPWETDAERRA